MEKEKLKIKYNGLASLVNSSVPYFNPCHTVMQGLFFYINQINGSMDIGDFKIKFQKTTAKAERFNKTYQDNIIYIHSILFSAFAFLYGSN